jgi:hypothetical protein
MPTTIWLSVTPFSAENEDDARQSSSAAQSAADVFFMDCSSLSLKRIFLLQYTIDHFICRPVPIGYGAGRKRPGFLLIFNGVFPEIQHKAIAHRLLPCPRYTHLL